MQKIKLQTPEGVREFLLISGTAEYDAAREAGEIHVGDDIVYKNYLVWIIDNFEMLILDMLQGIPQFDPGMPDMGNWSFTINGQPITPEQFSAAMGGGIPRQ